MYGYRQELNVHYNAGIAIPLFHFKIPTTCYCTVLTYLFPVLQNNSA